MVFVCVKILFSFKECKWFSNWLMVNLFFWSKWILSSSKYNLCCELFLFRVWLICVLVEKKLWLWIWFLILLCRFVVSGVVVFLVIIFLMIWVCCGDFLDELVFLVLFFVIIVFWVFGFVFLFVLCFFKIMVIINSKINGII